MTSPPPLRGSLDSYYAHTRLTTVNDSRNSWDFQFTHKEEELKNTLQELMQPEETTFRPGHVQILPKVISKHSKTPSKSSSEKASFPPNRILILKQLIHHLETDAYNFLSSQSYSESLSLLLQAKQSIEVVYPRHHSQQMYVLQ